MKFHPVLLAFLILALPTANAGSNFTPRDTFFDQEGVPSPNISFSVNGKTATWNPPGEWRVTGDPQKILVYPPDRPLANGKIYSTTLPENLVISDSTLKDFEELTLTALPQAAEDPKIVSSSLSRLVVSGLKTVQVIAEFNLNGKKFITTTTFAPKGEDLFLFEFTSSALYFYEMVEAFQGSLYTIAGL